MKYNMAFYELRRANGYTQTSLGRALGYHKETVSKIEAGRADGKVDFWRAVQKLFDIPDEDMWPLITGEAAPRKNMI